MFAYMPRQMGRLGIIVLLCVGCAAVEAGGEARPVPVPGKGDAVTSGLPFISEYVEATFGHEKAVEVYNPLPFPVTLDGCAVRVYSNGRDVANLRVSLKGEEIESGGTLVVCHSRASVIDSCDIFSSKLSYNGNDAIDLACDFGDGMTTIDVIGVIGEDPGRRGWTAGGAETRNQTLRRACSSAVGQDAFVAEEWEPAGADRFDDLGDHELCDAEPEETCTLGEGILGGPAGAILDGDDARFQVHIDQPVFANTTTQFRNLLVTGVKQFPLSNEVQDAGDAVAFVARDGGRIETYTIRDTSTGEDFDAVRFFMNDATEHSIVARAGETDPVAFSFDGEFFACNASVCEDGDLTLPFFQQLDEDFNPTDRFEILDQTDVLAAFDRRNRVFRSSQNQNTLLTAAWDEHFGETVTSLNALEAIARDPSGTLTYKFIAGPNEDLEAVVFELDGTDHGLIVVEDSLDTEALTAGGEVISCRPAG